MGARGSCVALGCTSPYRRSPIRIPGDHRLSNARPLRSRHVRGAATPASTVAIRAGLGLAPARGSVWHLLVQSALRTDYAGAAVSASGHARVPVSAEGPRAQQASYRNPRQPRAIAPISQPTNICALCLRAIPENGQAECRLRVHADSASLRSTYAPHHPPPPWNPSPHTPRSTALHRRHEYLSTSQEALRPLASTGVTPSLARCDPECIVTTTQRRCGRRHPLALQPTCADASRKGRTVPPSRSPHNEKPKPTPIPR